MLESPTLEQPTPGARTLDVPCGDEHHGTQRGLLGGDQQLGVDRLALREQFRGHETAYARGPFVGPQGDPRVGGLA